MDVAVTVAEFKRYLRARGYAKKTIGTYDWCIDEFRDYLLSIDIIDLRKVNHQVILSYQAKLNKSPLAMNSKAVKIRVVKRLFEYLTESNRLLINPTEGIIVTLRGKRKIGTVITMDEMRLLLDAPNLSLPSHIRDRAVMEVLYSTAIRSNELMNLHVYDVDFEDKVLFIRKGKGGRQRVVPLGPSALSYLREYLENVRPVQVRKNPKERKLFLNEFGNPLTWTVARERIKVYRNQAGIKKAFSLHAFRRTCATHMLQQGADIRYVQKLLGHKHLRTTQVYTKVIPVDVKKIHNKTHPNTGKEEKEDEG